MSDLVAGIYRDRRGWLLVVADGMYQVIRDDYGWTTSYGQSFFSESALGPLESVVAS